MSRVGWLVTGVVLLVLGGVFLRSFITEYRAAFFGSLPVAERIGHLQMAPPVVPGSVRGQQAALVACDQSLRSFLGRVQEQSVREAIARNCADAAAGVLRRAPTSSVAYQVAASAQLELGARDAFEAALLLSQRTAQQQEWLALRRLDLAAPKVAGLPVPVRTALAADVLTAISSASGRDQLASLYVRLPDARPFITSAAEAAPAAPQRAFLTAARRKMAPQ